MNWLHENDVDVGTHADLSAVISDIDAGEGYAGGRTYCQINQHPFREGNGIPIINTAVEAYLTASEISALEDTDDLSVARNSDLPESEPEMITLAHCLEKYVASDFDIPQNPFPQMTNPLASETNGDILYPIWKLPGEGGASAIRSFENENDIFFYGSSHFVLSNIENAGTIQMHYRDVHSAVGAWFAKWNFGGNPWYEGNNPTYANALKRRHIVASVVELIMMYNSGDTDHYRWQHYCWLGYCLEACGDIMPLMMKEAYISLLQKAFFTYLENNHYGLQSTLDQAQRLGVLFLALNNDPSIYNEWIDIFEAKSEYNFKDAKIASHSLDHDGGIDPPYLHRTLLFVMWCYPILKVRAPEKAAHMEAWMNRFTKFTRYLLFPEAGSGTNKMYYGPNGINVGTGTDLTRPQDPSKICWLNMAYWFPEARWYAWRVNTEQPFVSSVYIQSDTTMQSEVDSYVGNLNQFIFDETQVHSNPPGAWGKISGYDMNPIAVEYTQPDEWSTLSVLKTNLNNLYVEPADPDSIKVMFETSQDFVTAFGDDLLCAKLNSGTVNEIGCHIFTNDLGFRVSILTPVGDTEIAGFHGGISSLWHKNLGTILISRMRGQQGADGNDRLDATVSNGYYTGWYAWCDNHIGGLLSDGSVFTTGFFGRDYSSKSYMVDGSPVTPDTLIEGATSFDITVGDDLTPMREGYNPLSGQVDFTIQVVGDSSGFTKTTTFTADGTAQGQNIDELWEFLPLVIRARGQSSSFDRVIEISTDGGSSYSAPALGSIITGVDAIRISRGSDAVYIVPDATVHPSGWRMQFDSQLWQTAGDAGTVRIARVDLHGNPGTGIAFPASTTSKWKYQTTAP